MKKLPWQVYIYVLYDNGWEDFWTEDFKTQEEADARYKTVTCTYCRLSRWDGRGNYPRYKERKSRGKEK